MTTHSSYRITSSNHLQLYLTSKSMGRSARKYNGLWLQLLPSLPFNLKILMNNVLGSFSDIGSYRLIANTCWSSAMICIIQYFSPNTDQTLLLWEYPNFDPLSWKLSLLVTVDIFKSPNFKDRTRTCYCSISLKSFCNLFHAYISSPNWIRLADDFISWCIKNSLGLHCTRFLR